jgi:hypothetical protein
MFSFAAHRTCRIPSYGATRSYTITAEVEVPAEGAEGMLATLGGRFGGYGFHILKSKPVFTNDMFALQRFRWAEQPSLRGDNFGWLLNGVAFDPEIRSLQGTPMQFCRCRGSR